jgi:hypothetical protein
MTTSLSTVQRATCDDGVFEFINANTPFEVGFVDVPDAYRTLTGQERNVQYAILSPIPGEAPYLQCLTGVESDVELLYQVTCVGLIAKQASWIADQVRRVWSDRVMETGEFVLPLVISDHTVQDRRQTAELGAPQLESGLYQVVDTYEVKVSRG